MTTTDPTMMETPAVPAWLNLDAIVEADYMQRVAAARKRLCDNLPAIRECANEVRLLVRELDRGADKLPDGVYDAVSKLTGVADLHAIASAIGLEVDAATSGTIDNDASASLAMFMLEADQ